MGTFAIEKGHEARWLLGSVERLGQMAQAGLVGTRQRRVMRKFALRVSPDRLWVLFKTSDQWLEEHAPDFIRALEWVAERPPLPLDAEDQPFLDEEGNEVTWGRDDAWLDALLGVELGDDDDPLTWEVS
jgi:hypothetical protein